MTVDLLFFILLFTFIFFILLILFSNTKYPYLTALKSAGLGIVSLLVFHFIAPFTGITLGINLLTSAFSIILGLPGVLCLLALNWFV